MVSYRVNKENYSIDFDSFVRSKIKKRVVAVSQCVICFVVVSQSVVVVVAAPTDLVVLQLQERVL